MATTELGRDDLRRLASAAAQNALDLLSDAEILQDRHRWARACALAILAGEEAAKAFHCIYALLSDDVKVSRHDLERYHRLKLHAARYITDVWFPMLREQKVPPNVAEAITQLENAAKYDNATKQRALYVDIGPDGSLQEPADIDEAQATSVIANVTALVFFTGWITSGEVMRELENPSPEDQAWRTEFLRRLSDVQDRGGADAMVTFVADYLRTKVGPGR